MHEPAGGAVWSSGGGGSRRPTGTPSTVSRSRDPKFVIASTPTVYVQSPPSVPTSDPDDARGGADAALEAEAAHAGAGSDGALRRRDPGADRRPGGGERGGDVVASSPASVGHR